MLSVGLVASGGAEALATFGRLGVGQSFIPRLGIRIDPCFQFTVVKVFGFELVIGKHLDLLSSMGIAKQSQRLGLL
jgi:hypothetical protein